LHDAAILDSHVVEEACLVGTPGGWGAVETAGRRAPHGTVRQHDVAVGDDVGQLHPQIGQPSPHPADGCLSLLPVDEAAGDADAVLAVAGRVHEPARGLELLMVNRVDEAPVDVSRSVHLPPPGGAAVIMSYYYPTSDYLSTDDLRPG